MSALALHPLKPPRRILDLGCGGGKTIAKLGWNVETNDLVVGVDVRQLALASAQKEYPQRSFLSARGESLPFQAETFDVVLCNVALPYMDIPKALREVFRVLIPGGRFHLKVHPFDFALSELRGALPHPLRTLFRTYVLANGAVFHFTGRTPIGFFGRVESFQTERGMKRALERAGFDDIAMTNPGGTMLVRAGKGLGRKPIQ